MKDKLHYNKSNKFVLWVKTRKSVLFVILLSLSLFIIPVSVEVAYDRKTEQDAKVEVKESNDNIKVFHELVIYTNN